MTAMNAALLYVAINVGIGAVLGILVTRMRAREKVDILYGYPEWSAAALYEAGRCFREMGNPVEARKQFEQVQTKHGQTRWARLAAERLQELDRSSLPGH